MLVSYKTIGRNIRQARAKSGMTQEQAAEKLGISQLHFGRLERGERPASLEQIARIAHALQVTTFSLLHGCVVEEQILKPAGEDAQAFAAALTHMAEGVSPETRQLMLDVCLRIAEHDRKTSTEEE